MTKFWYNIKPLSMNLPMEEMWYFTIDVIYWKTDGDLSVTAPCSSATKQ